jgi:hypothetical protein
LLDAKPPCTKSDTSWCIEWIYSWEYMGVIILPFRISGQHSQGTELTTHQWEKNWETRENRATDKSIFLMTLKIILTDKLGFKRRTSQSQASRQAPDNGANHCILMAPRPKPAPRLLGTPGHTWTLADPAEVCSRYAEDHLGSWTRPC